MTTMKLQRAKEEKELKRELLAAVRRAAVENRKKARGHWSVDGYKEREKVLSELASALDDLEPNDLAFRAYYEVTREAYKQGVFAHLSAMTQQALEHGLGLEVDPTEFLDRTAHFSRRVIKAVERSRHGH